MTISNVLAPMPLFAAGLIVAPDGPFLQVFSEFGMLSAVMGMLGGLAFGLAASLPRWQVVRSSALGGLVAFGLGSFGMDILAQLLGITVTPEIPIIQAQAGASFLIGLTQEPLLHRIFRIIRAKEVRANDED